jgi:hypothetical protein
MAVSFLRRVPKNNPIHPRELWRGHGNSSQSQVTYQTADEVLLALKILRFLLARIQIVVGEVGMSQYFSLGLNSSLDEVLI